MSNFSASISIQNYNSTKGSIIEKWFQLTAFLFITLLLATPAKAQETAASIGELQIYSSYGYMFGGNLRTYNGTLNLGDNENFKIGLNYELAPGTQLEINWMHQSSDVKITEYGNFLEFEEVFDLNTDYIQIGVLQELRSGPVRPFGKFTTGAAIFSPEASTGYDDVWRFAFTFGGGIKAYLNDKVGLRLSGSMMMPVYWSGINFFCGPGGCSTGVTTGSAILQGELSAGLFVVIN